MRPGRRLAGQLSDCLRFRLWLIVHIGWREGARPACNAKTGLVRPTTTVTGHGLAWMLHIEARGQQNNSLDHHHRLSTTAGGREKVQHKHTTTRLAASPAALCVATSLQELHTEPQNRTLGANGSKRVRRLLQTCATRPHLTLECGGVCLVLQPPPSRPCIARGPCVFLWGALSATASFVMWARFMPQANDSNYEYTLNTLRERKAGAARLKKEWRDQESKRYGRRLFGRGTTTTPHLKTCGVRCSRGSARVRAAGCSGTGFVF